MAGEGQWSGLERASWAFGIVGSLAGVITLITVVVLIGQLSASWKNVENAKQGEVVGRFHSVVSSGDGLGIRPSAIVPRLSVPDLVKGHCQVSPSRLVPPAKRVCGSGWANLLECLGLGPDRFMPEGSQSPAIGFSTEQVNELIEGRVPMRWRGADFVNICALLGFQQKPGLRENYDRTALTFPVLWYGPVGNLIIRESPSGIIATFRPTNYEVLSVSPVVQLESDTEQVTLNLYTRAYHMVNCLPIGSGKAIFLGGRNKNERGIDPETAGDRVRRLWGLEEDEIFSNVESDLVAGWGLDCNSVMFFKFTLILEEQTPSEAINLHNFIVTTVLQPYVKAALLRVTPDGWVFTAHTRFCTQVTALLIHSIAEGFKLSKWPWLSHTHQSITHTFVVGSQSQTVDKLKAGLLALSAAYSKASDVSSLQGATFSSQDYQVLAQLGVMMREICGSGRDGDEIRWAMICSPSLVGALVDVILRISLEEILDASATIENQIFTCPELLGRLARFHVPHAQPSPLSGTSGYTYGGCQILAALADFALTGLWLLTSWPNNISYEALCIPDSVFVV